MDVSLTPSAGLSSSFRSLPIRIKLLIIIVGVCTLALTLSASLETLINWRYERSALIQELSVTAETLALQSRAPLEFLDLRAASENLAALEANPTIRIACVYNDAGTLFAFYPHATGAQNCPTLQGPQDIVRWDYLATFHDINHNLQRVGSIYLERSLGDMYERFGQQMLYKLIIVLFVILLVWLFSSYFQHSISTPIIELAALSRQFSQDSTHQLRATKRGDDEIGALVDAFNEMTAEIQRNQQQLGKAIAELTRSNTELERFAHMCSHDLQEPLRMVSNYTALLAHDVADKLPPETQQYLHFITDGASRMREMIKDILAYARINHQAEPLQKVDLNRQLDYVLKNLSASIEERKAAIARDPLPEVMANKTLIIQIFQNLISNALKFTTEKPRVEIRVQRLADAWEFRVKDNGIGIDPKYHDKIFEIFKRLNRREEFGGTGIGLAIVKKAVQYHHGKIWVTSEPGQYTTFHFTLPDHPTEGSL